MKLRHISARLLAGSAIALLATLGTVSAANAHDQLLSSDPANGATLTSSPKQLTLEFSGELQQLSGADATVVKLSVDGTEVPSKASTKAETVTVVPEETLESGDYTLDFNVISSDGHRVDDSIEFTLKLPVVSATPSNATAMGQASPSASAEAETPVQDLGAGLNPIVWIILGVVALGSVIAVLVNFMRNNKRS